MWTEVLGTLSEAVGKAEEVFKESVLPVAEAGLAQAKKNISHIDIATAVANTVALSQAAMADTIHHLSLARDHISQIDVEAGIADAAEKYQEVMAAVGPAAEQAGEWASDNPGLAVCAGIGLVGLGIVAAPGLVTAPLLGIAGFGQGGVVGGSLAAGAHARMGKVAAGSTFAVLQSAGAGGAGLAAINGLVHGSAAVVTIAACVIGGVQLADSEEERKSQ